MSGNQIYGLITESDNAMQDFKSILLKHSWKILNVYICSSKIEQIRERLRNSSEKSKYLMYDSILDLETFNRLRSHLYLIAKCDSC